MRRVVTIYALAITTALAALAVWGCCGLMRHVIVAVDKFGDAGAGLAQTTAHLNAPHGTIAMIDEDAGASKSLIIHADLVARHEQQQLNTWDERGTALFDNANGAVTDLRATINAGTKTEDAATETLTQTTATVADLRTMLPDLKRAMDNTADLTQHTDGIAKNVEATTGDLQAKLHPILNPAPCTTRMCKFKRDLSALKSAIAKDVF